VYAQQQTRNCSTNTQGNLTPISCGSCVTTANAFSLKNDDFSKQLAPNLGASYGFYGKTNLGLIIYGFT